MIQLNDETIEDEFGSHQTFTIDEEEEVHKLYHEFANRRLDYESPIEYKVRKIFVKAYVKKKKKGQFIWFSSNAETSQQFSMMRLAYNASKRKADEEETEDNIARAEKFFTMTGDAHREALQTNMGPLNLKEIKERIEDEQEDAH